MTIIHFIRHGSVHNPQDILYARLPRFGLSSAGSEQARAAAAYLQDRPLQAIISSPRLRARQTAAAIASGRNGLKVQQSALVDEILTPHQGRPIAELDAEGWYLYRDVPAGYETPGDVLARVRRLIRRLRAQVPQGETAVVTHGDVVLAVRFWAEDIPFTDETKAQLGLYPATGSVTTLTFTDGLEKPEVHYHKPY